MPRKHAPRGRPHFAAAPRQNTEKCATWYEIGFSDGLDGEPARRTDQALEDLNVAYRDGHAAGLKLRRVRRTATGRGAELR